MKKDVTLKCMGLRKNTLMKKQATPKRKGLRKKRPPMKKEATTENARG
jgi:hypothetical protein